ncbi:MAG: UDP-N-acetylmuramoyl-tripeptide--D-alanyl-D-alanine ligase [Lachnospiraceae bacterium]|nr:UDP-N-acetylmuramoyl-tripeptide--D-alanyl-D-alanine ligase [Lachnospiraceae bacterium]
MENITVKEILEATGGKLLCGSSDKVIAHFCIDSRQADETSLFVPIIGERVDAHKFMDGTIAAGAASLTMEHDSYEADQPVIKVPDTIKAMQDLAIWYRNKMDLPIVAVTGSVGKTTTREMITCVLKGKFKAFETSGNQNSQIGVPLTIDKMSYSDEIAVLELGMSERGQITILTNIAQPNVAVVTNVGVAHIEMLKTRENICAEKLDIQKGLKEGGVMFINGDNDMLSAHAAELVNHPFKFYGFGENCDIRAVDVKEIGGQTEFTCLMDGNAYPVVLNSLGDHMVLNALAAIGVGAHFGIPVSVASEQLSGFKGQRQDIRESNGYTVIDDTYNASPDSMKAALSILNGMNGKNNKIAVIADMLELGPNSPAYHREVGEYIVGTSITDVFAVGEMIDYALEAIREGNVDIAIHKFENNEELTAALKDFVKEGDAVLLKGSNGMKLKQVANQL